MLCGMEVMATMPRFQLFWEDDQDGLDLKIGYYKLVCERISECLSPDLLKKEYREENATNPMFGHCYVASEAIKHLVSPELTPYYGKDDRGITHWWLHDEKDHMRIDPTCAQYYSQKCPPPYHNGKRASFLTNDPSKRACIVMDRFIENTINFDWGRYANI